MGDFVAFNPREVDYWLGASTDTKPTDASVPVGAYAIETDTEDWFQWDGTTWNAATPVVGVSITVTASALPSNAAKETGGNLAAAKTDLDAIKNSLAATSALNITNTADHIVKSGAGTLVRVVLNTAAPTSTLKVYDGTTAGGTLLATLDGTGATPQGFIFNIAVAVGVFAKATGTADWTVTYL